MGACVGACACVVGAGGRLGVDQGLGSAFRVEIRDRGRMKPNFNLLVDNVFF